jgi:hypothetical protein
MKEKDEGDRFAVRVSLSEPSDTSSTGAVAYGPFVAAPDEDGDAEDAEGWVN